MPDEERTYPSDDRDLERCNNELVVFRGENGDWYVSIRKIGERIGPHVRVTTSGAPRGREAVARAVFQLHTALRSTGEQELEGPSAGAFETLERRIELGKRLGVDPRDSVYALTLSDAEALKVVVEKLEAEVERLEVENFGLLQQHREDEGLRAELTVTKARLDGTVSAMPEIVAKREAAAREGARREIINGLRTTYALNRNAQETADLLETGWPANEKQDA